MPWKMKEIEYFEKAYKHQGWSSAIKDHTTWMYKVAKMAGAFLPDDVAEECISIWEDSKASNALSPVLVNPSTREILSYYNPNRTAEHTILPLLKTDVEEIIELEF